MQYKCRICDQGFHDPAMKCRHEQLAHGMNGFWSDQRVSSSCQLCRRSYSNKQTLESHLRRKHDYVPKELGLTEMRFFQCDHCDMIFALSDKRKLQKHLHAHRYENLKVKPLKLRKVTENISIEGEKRFLENYHQVKDRKIKKMRKRVKRVKRELVSAKEDLQALKKGVEIAKSFVEKNMDNERQIIRNEERDKLQQELIGMDKDRSKLIGDLASLQKKFDELKEENDLRAAQIMILKHHHKLCNVKKEMDMI